MKKETRHRGTVIRVGLWGPVGSGNMGNEMTMSAIIQNLRRLNPNIDLYGFSWNPRDTAERHGITSFPIKRGVKDAKSIQVSNETMDSVGLNWKTKFKCYPHLYRTAKLILHPLLELAFLYRSICRLKGIDLLLFTGTGILTDSWGGAMGFPYRLFLWSNASRISRSKIAVVSSGAGPIKSSLSKLLIRRALLRTSYRSFRDEYSKMLIESLGVNSGNHVFPDLAFSLNIHTPVLQENNQKQVVIACLPYRKPGCWENPSSDAYGGYLDTIAKFTTWLLEKGYIVHLVPTQVRTDPIFIKDLQLMIESNYYGNPGTRLIAEPVETFEQVILHLSKGSIIVTSRFHGIVFSYLLGKPVLGISYHAKIRELMKDFDQEEFCLEISTLNFALLSQRFQELEAAYLPASEKIKQTVGRYKILLEQQYQKLLDIL